MAVTLQLLAILPSRGRRLLDKPPMLEFDLSENPLRDDSILKSPISVDAADGCVPIPEGPGLGIETDEEKITKYLVK